MIRPPRPSCTPLLVGALLGSLLLTVPRTGNAEAEVTPASDEGATSAVSYQNYSGLADLITMICDDALERFQDFYGPSLVTVEPFTTIGLYQGGKRSELGVTLADQMSAIINNDTLTGNGQARGRNAQRLKGVLQEVDGFLRIHLSGINAAGARTSYVVSVEMSEPIYRALHTYL